MLLGGCGTKNVGISAPAGPHGKTVANTACSQIGKMYAYGGSSPKQGFDCSGLVYWAYKTNGIKIPRNSAKQAKAGIPVSKSQAAPGDIVVFRTGLTTLHTGLYTGNNRFVHSPSKGKRVRLESMDQQYWKGKLVAIRRIQ